LGNKNWEGIKIETRRENESLLFNLKDKVSQFLSRDWVDYADLVDVQDDHSIPRNLPIL